MKKIFLKARLIFQRRLKHQLETGFSMLEAVVVVGVLLALAVGGFLSYGPIIENAKMAKMKSAASEVLTAATVANLDGLSDTDPQGVLDAWNASTESIEVVILEPAGGASGNGNFCIQATDLESPATKVLAGDCSDVTVPADTGGSAETSGVMISIWNTSLPGCSTITLPLAGSIDVTVDWGDGTASQEFTAAVPPHNYADPSGTKTITIDGFFTTWGGADPWSTNCLTEVSAWGETGTTNLYGGFSGAENITRVAEIPSTTTDIGYLFAFTSFNGDINSWDISNVTNMEGMFSYTTAFNKPLSSWDTSSVTNMNSVFFEAEIFNQNINSWDTSSVTDMNSMFYGAAQFDQPLDTWLTTDRVTDTSYMFMNASAFNQNISGWKTAEVVDMSAMFSGATAFNQNLSSWNTAKVTKATLFRSESALTAENLPPGALFL